MLMNWKEQSHQSSMFNVANLEFKVEIYHITYVCFVARFNAN